MRENYSKPKKIKSFLVVVLIFFTSFLIYFFVFKGKSNKVDLTQKATPPPSLFKPDEIAPANLDPIFLASGFDQGNIFGINENDGSLIRFKDGVQTTIYSGKVHDYYVKENTAIVLDDSDLSKIIVINLETKLRREINLKTISPIISVTLSDDLQTIYFLSEFSINTKLPKLNSVPINGGQPVEIIETKAQNVRYLKNDILLLFVENHDHDKNDLIFFDVNKNQTILSKTINSYLVSPDRNNVSLQTSNKVEIVSTSNFSLRSKSIETSSRSAWKDNNTLVIFRNDDKGLNYSVLTLNPFAITPFRLLVERIVMQTAYGFINDILYWQGYNGSIYQNPISIN